MSEREWSRSRYWLCHFLHNRHERVLIPWVQSPAPSADTLTPQWRALLNRVVAHSPADDQGLIRRALRACDGDPAYVQSLRLYIKELQHHRQLLARLLHTSSDSGQPTVSAPRRQLRKHLGLRFELADRLLSDLIDLALLRLARPLVLDPQAAGVCDQLLHDRSAHAAFHRERLTMQYADFNFIRRNARRHRLRVIFVGMVAGAALRHAALLRAAGSSPGQFTRDTFNQFRDVLERMVPYHREALLAALLAQREHPFEKTV